MSGGIELPTFRRVGQTNLYTEVIESGPNQTPNHGPLAYYIPPSASILPPLISMDQAWNWFKYSSLWPGYFLFFQDGATIPGATRSGPSPELTALLDRLNQAVPPMRVRTATGFGWVQGDPMDAQSVAIQFLETGWDPVAGQPNQRAISSQRFVQELTYHQVGLVIGEAMLITLDADESGFEINHQRSATNSPTDRGLLQRDPPPGPSQNIWIHGADGVKIDKVGRTLTLPLFGEDRGALEVPLEALIQDDFQPNALDSALYYFGPGASQDQFQALRFPVVDLNVNGASAATTTQIDLEVNLYGAQPEHSYFDYGVGQDDGDGGGRGTAQAGGTRPVLGSFLRTYDGHLIHVAPTTNSRLTGTNKPNNGAWGNYPTQLGPLLYFSPHGSFELVMDDPAPPENWIIGGFAGTEYISFTPRNGDTPGDVVTFYPHEPAYAPKFGSTTPSSGGDLLTLDQRTSWVSVESFPEQGNAPPIQYFAQPDDAPLFGTDTVGSTNPYLVFKAIPANNLPVPADASGLDSFPLAPFSGIEAPDPQVDETADVTLYRSYEQTVLSPQRKERISSVAVTTRASASGRTLEQAGNENTTTPQGILATINGSDFVDITLADNEDLLLKLDQINDQFQDSLQTNRLFLPITQGSTIHWLDNAGVPSNYMTIEDWPFQVEVGGLPSGITEPVTNFYNVLIFKYYDRSLTDLLEDTSLWSQPGHYNADPSALQDWIKTFIADTKTRAEDPELAPLYANFLDIVDNPNWNGIVALNVSLPLQNLPTEVQGLLSGIKHLDRFVAHHFGINVSKISPDASTIDRSSLFGLIDYVDDELHPSDADYDFRVGLLQVLFANTEIASFDARIYVKLNLLFDEPSTLTDSSGNPVPGNEVELIGTYEDRDGEPSYSFTFEGDDEFVLDPNSPALAAVSIKDAEFVTISGPDPDDFSGGQPLPIISEFQFAGDLRFVDNEDFDFFSYEAIGFTGLTLGVQSEWTDDGSGDWIPVQPAAFDFSAFNVSLDGKSATVRPDSLFANFPLVLADFTVASLTFSLSSLGYIPVPGIVPGTNPVLAPKYSLEYSLSLGTQGVMVTINPGFALKLLVGWTPSTSDKGGVATGFKFPLVSGGGSTIGIQGVLQLSLTDLGFVKMSEIIDGVDTNMYAFFLNSAALHVLGVQIPPGGSFSMALFVPESQSGSIDLSNLGWFVAYSADSASTSASPPLPPVVPGPPAEIASGPDIQVVAAAAVPAKSGDNTDITIYYTLRNNGPTDAEFDVFVNRILPFAAPYGPPFNRQNTYQLGSGERIRREVVWNSVPDGTHRFEVNAVLSGDENATNDGQVTNAVSVAAPSSDDVPIFKLDYLGIGQRVGFPAGTGAFGSVESAITGMGSIIPAGLGSDGLVAHLKKIYDPNGGWLIAFDFTLFGALRLAFIFDERDEMYGVLIGFAKEAPGPLKGFKFQILYKKVSDSVGVYMLDLTLPDIIRQWQFGTVAITLPNIGIDIYTNGDFKVDVGFPAGFDFTRSFNVQFQAGPLPIIGYGGFYFAVLSTETSSTIPQLKANSTAQFNPVLEAGFGLSVGLGKTIEKGILRAGATITIEGILEGTVAWYIPPDGATSAIVEDGMTRALQASFAALTGPPDYFRIKGQVQIVGRIYGKVDFGVVSAGVSLVAKAGVAITFESYGDLVFLLYAEVTATASITIAFITLDFSFSLKIKFEFTVENFMGDAPWQSELASGTSARLALQAGDGLADTPIAWTNQDLDGAQKPITVYLAPQMVPVDGQANLVASLIITKGGSPSTDFEDLLDDLLLWTVGLADDSDIVDPAALTVAGLQEILNRMSPPATPTTLARQASNPLNFELLQEFLNTNFTFSLANADTLDTSTPGATAATVFPMVPGLVLDYGATGTTPSTIDFATHNDRDEDFEDNLAEYFAALLADFEAKTQASALRAMLQASSHSMAEIVFQDYFAFLIKSGIDQMQQQLEADGAANKPVADLIADTRSGGGFATVAATAARYFLHGLQLPANPTELANFDPNIPSTIPDDIQALYGLTGQQVPVIPATGDGDIWSANLKIGPENVLFPSGTSVTHTFTDANAQAIIDVAGKTFGLADITTQLPPTVDDAAREFAFRDYVDVAGGAANARLYPFSDAFQTLVANEAASGNNVTANVNIGTPNNQPILTPVPASDWSWALQAGLTVQRFPSDKGGEPLTNVYQLGGTDQITRNVIANIIEAGPAIASIRLLYAPEEGGGLVMGPDQGVTLLKINLSTVTAPPRELLQATSTGIFTASISDATNFLTLVWQVSVVNAGGFYLHVDGDGLPDHVFGEGSDPAPITLLVEFSDDSTVSNYANALSITSEVPEGSFPYVNTPDIPAWYPSAAPGTVPFIVSRDIPVVNSGDAVAENLYNLLTYWLAGGNGFNETIHGLPVGPTEDAATADDGQWHFHQTMPIARYYAAGGGSPYAGVGQTTSISFAFLDVFGNPMPIDGGANLPALPVTIRYFDPLIGITQWPSIETSHIFNNDGTLDAKLVFSGSGFVQAAGESTTAFEDRVEAALDKYLNIQGQLSGVGVSAVLETTIAPGISTDAKAALDGFVASIIGTLQDQLDSGTPATDLTLDLSLAISTAARNAVAANIQEVEVFVRIARDAQYVDTDASDVIPEVAQVSITISAATQSVIDPESGDPVDSTLAFALYAEQFETAFPEFKLATGPGDAGASAVWAVRMGDLSAVGQGISYAIDSTKPQFFAPAPLSTNLLSRSGVEIFPEGPGNPTATRTFSNVDMDLWGRQFTTAVDKFLSPASAAAAQAKNGTDYNRVVAAKGPLADGVSLGVVPVLTSTGDMDDDLAAARETFKQRVLVGAANAYEIETVVQYPVATTNTDPNLVPEFAPNLYGKIRSLTPEDTEANPDDADYSFSSAKIALQNGGGGNNTNLTFLFDARRQLNLSSVDAGIGYQISHVEHQIENVPFGGGTSGTNYTSSMWISLVRPIRDIDVDPSSHVPIALREYPIPPGLKSQTAVQASLNGSTTISNATLWDYTYTYEQQAIAQDTILSNVRFNVGPNVATRGLAQDVKDLFDWLGRFSVEYPVFADNLSDIDAMESANITWFAELVEGVANAWGPWVTQMASTRSTLQAALEEFQWGYQVDEVIHSDTGTVDIIVHRDAPDPALVPPRTEARFPDIQLTLPDNSTIVLDDPSVSGDEATYTFDWAGELPDRRVRSLIIDDLDILNVENGWGGIQLARNLNLSAYEGRSTNPSFIYQTPLVRFVNKVTPMIDVRTPINIPDNVTASGTSLAAYLEAMLDALFHGALEPGAKDRLAKIGVRYGFDNRGQQTVAEGPLQGDEVIVELPVLQRMPFEYRPDQAAALAGPLAQEIQEWFDAVLPLTAGGYYDIDFSVFAALSNTQLPVLRVRHLWIGLNQIS